MSALRLARDVNPNMLIVDLDKPTGNGFAIREMLCNEIEDPRFPIIFLSGKTMSTCRLAATKWVCITSSKAPTHGNGWLRFSKMFSILHSTPPSPEQPSGNHPRTELVCSRKLDAADSMVHEPNPPSGTKQRSHITREPESSLPSFPPSESTLTLSQSLLFAYAPSPRVFCYAKNNRVDCRR